MDVCSRVAQRILLRVYSKLLTPLDCLLRSFGRTLNAVKTRSPKVEFRRSPKVLPQTSLPQGFWRPHGISQLFCAFLLQLVQEFFRVAHAMKCAGMNTAGDGGLNVDLAVVEEDGFFRG